MKELWEKWNRLSEEIWRLKQEREQVKEELLRILRAIEERLNGFIYTFRACDEGLKVEFKVILANETELKEKMEQYNLSGKKVWDNGIWVAYDILIPWNTLTLMVLLDEGTMGQET